MMREMRLFGLILVILAGNGVLSAETHLEPCGDYFYSFGGGVSARVAGRDLLLSGPGAGEPVSLHWEGEGSPALRGEAPTGGHTNYYGDSGPASWRLDVPHYGAVRARQLYKGIDFLLRSPENLLEFDLEVAPGVDPRAARMHSSATLVLGADGALQMGAEGMRLKRPVAYQAIDGRRREVEARFELDSPHSVHFRVGAYDRARPLTIDPVVEYATYVTGNGNDLISSVTADAAGQAVIGGISNSTNFPGVSFGSVMQFHYVTKVSADASAILFTTVFAAAPSKVETPLTFNGPMLDVDDTGNTYAVGYAGALVATTAGAWRTARGTGYAMKLDSGGHMVYSTYLGDATWSATASRIRVRNGVAFLAGTLQSSSFTGTPGAYQEKPVGSLNAFVIALKPDGSGPLLATAFGAGSANVADMTLDTAGNVVLLGGSSSGLPLTADALPYQPPAGQIGQYLARLDSSGSRLLNSTYLDAAVDSIEAAPDGSGFVLVGPGTPPASFTAAGVQNTVNLPQSSSNTFAAKITLSPLAPVWTTRMNLLWQPGHVQTDSAGHVYLVVNSRWASGGSPAAFGQIVKLSQDGGTLEFLGGPNAVVKAIAVRQGAHVYAGMTSFGASLSTTPGVLQPVAPVKNVPPFLRSLDFTSLARLDLSAFTGQNFFLQADVREITWRIGEPAPDPVSIPLYFPASRFPLTLNSGSAALTASTTDSAVSVKFNPPGSGVAGSTTESITVSSAAEPAKSFTFPVNITILRAVSFSLASDHLDFHIRNGQPDASTASVPIATDFGKEFFNLDVSSSNPAAVTGFVNYVNNAPVLMVTPSPAAAPGTYDATLTVSIPSLKNNRKTLAVHVVVDAASKLTVTPTTLSLHVVKNGPASTVSFDVSSDVPGSQFTLNGGGFDWLKVQTSSNKTPARVTITADTAAAPVGIYTAQYLISSETNERFTVFLNIDVSGAAALTATPTAIDYTWYRGGATPYQAPMITITAPTASDVTLTADKPWIRVPALTRTPGVVTVDLDTTLAEGVYQGNITLAAGSNRVVVPVTWRLYGVTTLVYPKTPLSFSYQFGGLPAVQSQQFQVSSSGAGPAPFYAGPDGATTFLTVTQSSGGLVTVTANPWGLEPGVYKGGVGITPLPPTSGGYEVIPVVFQLRGNPDPAPANVASVGSAASYANGFISPGEIVVLFGTDLGPDMLTVAQPDAGGNFPLQLSGTGVVINGRPAPLIYVSRTQIAAVVPYGVAGTRRASVYIASEGRVSVPANVDVVETAPALFTLDASGTGAAAALRADASGALTVTSESNPIASGEVLVLYATGLGTTTPGTPDGRTNGVNLPKLDAQIQVLLNGQLGEVLYAGPAPGLIAGAMQINVRVPAGVPKGRIPVVVLANSTRSADGVTIYTR